MPPIDLNPLHDQVAVVTGGSRNIGRAIALRLASSGAHVVVVGRRDAKAAEAVAAQIEALGRRGLARLADVGEEGEVQALVDAVVGEFGRLDILVNNAAMRRPGALETMTLEGWREVTRVILDGAFLCARACLTPMIAAGGGVIVNIGGMSGHIGGKERAHVVSAKAGVVGFTKALAVEFADRGIRANCVVPGLIDTVRGESAQAPPVQSAEANAVLRRRGRPEEVAAMVNFLCLPESAFITGQTMHVNGGRYLP